MKSNVSKMSMGFFLVSVFLLSIIGCASSPQMPQTPPTPLPATSVKPDNYLLRPGDQLAIKFFYNPELNETVTIRPDGKISLQLVDDVLASGLAPSELDRVLTEKYSKELKQPEVTVIVNTFSSPRFYVGGEVNNPGLYEFQEGMTALHAVFSAGGFLDTAKPEAAILIRKGPENQPVPTPINLRASIENVPGSPPYEVQPDDIIYVPKSEIAKANLWVNQYIEELFLFRGVSLGFSYRINDDD